MYGNPSWNARDLLPRIGNFHHQNKNLISDLNSKRTWKSRHFIFHEIVNSVLAPSRPTTLNCFLKCFRYCFVCFFPRFTDTLTLVWGNFLACLLLLFSISTKSPLVAHRNFLVFLIIHEAFSTKQTVKQRFRKNNKIVVNL